MNIPKKIIGWWFFLTGMVGGMLLGFMQIGPKMGYTINADTLMWPYSFIYISFLGSWFALFDYIRQRDEMSHNVERTT